MKFISLSILFVIALPGCAELTKEDASTVPNAVHYACERGPEIQVTFFQEKGLATVMQNSEVIELMQAPVASGFQYSNGATTIRGKGDSLMLEIGRMAPIVCAVR